jgi:hypothetical protein
MTCANCGRAYAGGTATYCNACANQPMCRYCNKVTEMKVAGDPVCVACFDAGKADERSRRALVMLPDVFLVGESERVLEEDQCTGNYVNARSEGSSTLADRVSREYAQERQRQLQDYAEARSKARLTDTVDDVKEAFVENTPHDDTGYIDTTQLEQDVARILEAQGPDWYLQPDDPEPELSTHATMDQRFNAWMSVSLVGGFVLAALTISGVALKSGVLALVGLACMCLWVFVVMPKLEWLLVGRWEQTLSRSPAKR